MRSFIICTAHQYCSGDQIDKNDMAGHVAVMGEIRGV